MRAFAMGIAYLGVGMFFGLHKSDWSASFFVSANIWLAAFYLASKIKVRK